MCASCVCIVWGHGSATGSQCQDPRSWQKKKIYLLPPSPISTPSCKMGVRLELKRDKTRVQVGLWVPTPLSIYSNSPVMLKPVVFAVSVGGCSVPSPWTQHSGKMIYLQQKVWQPGWKLHPAVVATCWVDVAHLAEPPLRRAEGRRPTPRERERERDYSLSYIHVRTCMCTCVPSVVATHQ